MKHVLYYVASCLACGERLSFTSYREREGWTAKHREEHVLTNSVDSSVAISLWMEVS